MTWPNDVDGDVFRSLVENEFDFEKEHDIDFNVDFITWPPPQEALNILRKQYPNIEVIEPQEIDDEGYLVFQVKAKVNYELVTSVQKKVTEIVKAYGGKCESWGVMN